MTKQLLIYILHYYATKLVKIEARIICEGDMNLTISLYLQKGQALHEKLGFLYNLNIQEIVIFINNVP